MLHLEGKNYMIQGNTSQFANRQKSISDQLDAIKNNLSSNDTAESHVNVTGTEPDRFVSDVCVAHRIKKLNTKHFKGRQSIFKRPELTLSSYKKIVPGFKHNPRKWVRYSLSDVPESAMSEESNRAAAVAAVNDAKIWKETEQPFNAKITFKKPGLPKTEDTPVDLSSNEGSNKGEVTSYFKGSKLIMPEYVVGEKKKVNKQVHTNDVDTRKKNDREIKLNHLTEFDDGNDEDDE